MAVADHRGEELRREVGLEVGALERQLRVRGAVRLAEAEPRERADALPELARLLPGEPGVVSAALQKGALRGPPGVVVGRSLVLAVHHLADHVRLPEGEAGDLVADLGHVFLEGADVVRLPQDRLQRRVHELPVPDPHLALALALDVELRVRRAGRAHETGGDRDLLEGLGLRFLVEAPLRRALDVEDPLGAAPADDLPDPRVGVALLEVPDPGVLDPLLVELGQRVAQHRQRAVAEDVELDQPELVDAVVHVDLGDGAVLRAPGGLAGDVAADRAVGDQHPAGMLPQVARLPLEAPRQLPQHRDLAVLDALRPRLAALENGGDLVVGVAEHLGRLAEGGAGAEVDGRAGDGDALRPPAVDYEVVHQLALVPAEVEVGVRGRGPVLVEEALEVEVVADRVEVADPDVVEGDRVGGAAAQDGAVRGPAVAASEALVGPVADLLDDQEIGGVAELGDHLELHRLELPRLFADLRGLAAVVGLEAGRGDLGQATFRGVSGRHRGARHDPPVQLELDVAAGGDLPRVGQGLGAVGEQLLHARRRGEHRGARGRLSGAEPREGRVEADRGENAVDLPVAGVEKEAVVRRRQRQAQGAGGGGELGAARPCEGRVADQLPEEAAAVRPRRQKLQQSGVGS